MLYFVSAIKKPENVQKKIKELFKDDDVYELDSDKWVVSSDKTSRALAEELGIISGESTGVVLRVTSYSGRAPGDFWEWLSIKNTK